MKVGDLVKHIGFGEIYLVAKIDGLAKGMIGILVAGELRWVARNWLEVIHESR